MSRFSARRPASERVSAELYREGIVTPVTFSGAEGLDGDGGRQGRVDPPAQPDDDLARNRSSARSPSSPRRGRGRSPPAWPARPPAPSSPGELPPLALRSGSRQRGGPPRNGGPGQNFLSGVHDQAPAVEDELVLTAHEVDVADRRPVLPAKRARTSRRSASLPA